MLKGGGGGVCIAKLERDKRYVRFSWGVDGSYIVGVKKVIKEVWDWKVWIIRERLAGLKSLSGIKDLGASRKVI